MPRTRNKPTKAFEVLNKKSGAEIYILDEISSWTENNASEFKRKIDAIGENEQVKLYINSPGGSVDQGLAIYNLIKPLANRMEAHVIGMALSTASWLAMSAGKVCMRENSLMMIHNPTTWGMGDEDDLESATSMLKKVKDIIVNVYATKSGKSKEEIAEMMSKETWMTAEEAMEHGFVDEVADEEPEVGMYNIDNLELPQNVYNAVSKWKNAKVPDSSSRYRGHNQDPEPQSKKRSMKNLLKILVENKIINSVDTEESDVVLAISDFFKSKNGQSERITALQNQLEEKDSQIEELRKVAAETAVNAYVQSRAIPENEKDAWVEMYLENRDRTVKLLENRKPEPVGGEPIQGLGVPGAANGPQTELDKLQNEYDQETDSWKKGEIARKMRNIRKNLAEKKAE